MKRGVLLVLLVVILSFAVTAHEINVTLSSDKVGADQPLQGEVMLELDGNVGLDDEIEVYIDNSKVGTYAIRDLLKGEDYTEIENSFRKVGHALTVHDFVFPSAGKHVFGIDITQGIFDFREIGQVYSIAMDLKGKSNGGYPTSVSVDIGDNGESEFTYVGAPKQDYIYLEQDYIKTDGPTIERYIDNNNNMFCQEVILEPSTSYQIRTTVKRNVAGPKLYAAVLDSPSYSTYSFNNCTLDSSEYGCCEIGVTNQMGEKSCAYGVDIQTREKGYACIFALGESEERGWFSVLADTSSPVKGYYNGRPSTVDYYVTAAYRDYEKELKDVTLFSLDEEDDSLNEVYRSIADCRRKEECIIPVAISSKSKGTVEVSDLRLDMEVGGAGVITNFYDLELTGDLASYDGVLVFDLIQAIANTPDRVGREYDVHVEINGERSNDVAFETIKLPEPHMRFSDEEVAIGQEVLFDLRDAESDFDDAIVGFDWDFGDGESSSGPIAVHSYSSGGTYVVVASVTDTAGRTGYQARRILVEGEEENETVEPQSFEGKLDKTITEVESMIAGLGSFDAEVVQALGYSQRLNKAHSDLTALKNGSQSPTNVTVNRDMRYNNIIRGLPKDISVQSTTFEGKIKSLDKIPAASALMLEDELGFKNKLFLAQKGLVLTSVAKAVTVKTFAGGTDNFVLIKKTVSGPGEIYELIPTGVNVVQVLTPGHSEIGTNVMKFSGVQEVSYIVESADLMLVTKAKTLVVPSDLSGFEVGSGGFEDMFNCGDGLCESGVEDKHSCPEDCKGGFPWGVVIVMLVVILLGVFYIYFYKGPGSFDDLNSKLKGNKKQFRPGVKRPVGNLALKRYVRGAMAKGIPRNKIIFALKKKGWNEAQIRNAFK